LYNELFFGVGVELFSEKNASTLAVAAGFDNKIGVVVIFCKPDYDKLYFSYSSISAGKLKVLG
jgi:hypothetical protein